ncbi:hypothetical protein [Streptomyces olivaceus]|uniref:hypothetical protein n=1 Tax=Streptomyces olivaceus TaxID=47716 RepID=UPI0004C90BF1|nr:hypothetical protein [Streptomyces olivaceus]MBZ6106682.1 hypothetical protein [Streptomyces olivaceus]
MTGPAASLQDTLNTVAASRNATISLLADGRTLRATYAGRQSELALPIDGTDLDRLAHIPSALPSRARGDVREKTLYNILQDMSDNSGNRVNDENLREKLADLLQVDQGHRQVLAAVTERQYWIHPTSASNSPRSFLAPFHSELPTAFDYAGRYKSFRGNLLLFLCWDGSGFDTALADEIAKFLGSEDGLSPLDRVFLNAARTAASSQELAPVSSRRLLERYGEALRNDLAPGAFDQESLDRIRRDLLAVVKLQLPRHDKAHALIAVFSLHIALYYYRLAFRLGTGLDCAAAVLDGKELPERPRFEGRILFRVGSAGDRPVRASDACAQAWRHLDEHHLLALPANMVSANLVHQVAQVSGSDCGPVPDPYACAQALAGDPVGRVLADLLCAAAAVMLRKDSTEVVPSDPGIGVYALREAVLASFRSRGNALKQRGRDIVNTFVGGFSGELKRNRGRVRFFELDEQVIFLLVKLLLDNSGRNQLAFRQEFLPGLREYGLAPQDAAEEELLSQALGRLGLLERYSDAGEALYVRHIL